MQPIALANEKQDKDIPIKFQIKNNAEAASARHSPDGTKLYVDYLIKNHEGKETAIAKVFDANSGLEIREFTSENRSNILLFSPDGTKYVTDIDKGVYSSNLKPLIIVDTESGKILQRIEDVFYIDNAGFQHWSSIAFNPAGNQIFVTNIEDGGATCWDIGSGKKVFEIRSPDKKEFLTDPIYSPDGKTIAVKVFEKKMSNSWAYEDDHDTYRMIAEHSLIIDSQSGKPLKEFSVENEEILLKYSPDGTKAIISTQKPTRSASVWDIVKSSSLFSLERVETQFYNSLKFSPDGKKILGLHNGGSVSIWCAGSGKILANFNSNGARFQTVYRNFDITSAEFSPNGKNVILGGSNGTANILDISKNEIISSLYFTYFRDIFCETAFYSPDGNNILTLTKDKTICIWSLRPQYDFALEELPTTLSDLQKNAYRQGGLKNFYKELQNIAEKETPQHDQKLILFLTIQAFLKDPVIQSIQQIKEEVLPSLEKSAKELTQNEKVTTFSDIRPSVTLVHTVLSLMRACVLAMQEQGGLTPSEQEKLTASLTVLRESQLKLSNTSSNQLRLLLNQASELVQNLEPANSMIVETWARSDDLRSSYARVYEILLKYLESI